MARSISSERNFLIDAIVQSLNQPVPIQPEAIKKSPPAGMRSKDSMCSHFPDTCEVIALSFDQA